MLSNIHAESSLKSIPIHESASLTSTVCFRDLQKESTCLSTLKLTPKYIEEEAASACLLGIIFFLQPDETAGSDLAARTPFRIIEEYPQLVPILKLGPTITTGYPARVTDVGGKTYPLRYAWNEPVPLHLHVCCGAWP
ncbi:unnamed protein product [Phytophthora lilii]|uniref:Unnamed protein product n=1 Tax=Phytophthora lilii TaxID=2077276 RepID=A0A9W6WMM9_9STRA|nr:unnamed protein product [Phytophthora lilii]